MEILFSQIILMCILLTQVDANVHELKKSSSGSGGDDGDSLFMDAG